jgi:hypothetical protein
MNKTFVGIDPGLSGGIAIQHPEGDIALFSMPDDLSDINDIIPHGAILILEKVPPYVGRNIPSSASFKLGKSCGWFEGYATGRQHPLFLVSPQTWQAGLGIPKGDRTQSQWKSALKAEAGRRFPHVNGITLKTADALLILHWGLRNAHFQSSTNNTTSLPN